MENRTTLRDVLELARKLSPVDQVRLIEEMAPEIERALAEKGRGPRQSLWGLCADLGSAPSADEIDKARRQDWADFPRGDI